MRPTAETMNLHQFTTQHTSITAPASVNYGTMPISVDVPRVYGFCPSVDVRIKFGATVAAAQPSATSAIIPAGVITYMEIPRLSGHLGVIPVGASAGTLSMYGYAGVATTATLL